MFKLKDPFIRLRPSYLKVFSAFLVNIAASMILLAFTIMDIVVLIANVGFAILALIIAIYIEDFLE